MSGVQEEISEGWKIINYGDMSYGFRMAKVWSTYKQVEKHITICDRCKEITEITRKIRKQEEHSNMK